MNTTTREFSVTGMTCSHCVRAVTGELEQLDGVTHVTVDLVAGGTSIVKVAGTSLVTEADVEAALDEAGDYKLAD